MKKYKNEHKGIFVALIVLTVVGVAVFGGLLGLLTSRPDLADVKAQWDSISKHPMWASSSSISKIHCSDGDVTK